MRTKFIILPALLLSACIPVQEPPIDTGRSDKPEEIRGEESATETRALTGAVAVAERLLPNGILEIGKPNAPLTLLSFTEHHCTYCGDFVNDLLPQLREDFIDKGALKYQVVILPLKKYKNSRGAAAALLCSAAQGKGLEMHELLFGRETKDRITALAHADTLELDVDAFTVCLDSDATAQTINGQEEWARSLDIGLVPTFLLNGKKFVGLPYYPDLRGRIENEEDKR